MSTQPDILFVERFIPDPDALLNTLLANTVWDTRMRARLTASYGLPYNYTNLTYPEAPMPAYLQEVCEALRARLGFTPNNCLLNNYPDGTSSIGFHADSLQELVPGTGVVTVSLGDTRTLTFRRTHERNVRWNRPLPHGSMLYMPPEVQLAWQHGVLPQEGAGQRVSMTFRAKGEHHDGAV